mgnify:CR=1 FL=1
MSASSTVIYTLTDEAPALATCSLLPIVRRFTRSSGVRIEQRDISLAGRILAAFPDHLKPDQQIADALSELGELAKTPAANIIKLPNISASVPQLTAAIRELQQQGFAVPDFPEEPQTDAEKDIRARYNKVLGSAVNPVLREGNSDRRVAAPVKEYARRNPHSMGAWSADSRTRVASMSHGDFYGTEQSHVMSAPGSVRIELVHTDGTVKVLKENLALQAGEVIDASCLNVRTLRTWIAEQLAVARQQDILLSLHLKATMMKVSHPIVFGHCVRIFYKEAFEKHAKTLEELGVNVNNGMVDLYNKIAKLPESQREEIMRDLHACHEKRPELAMVDSAKGITNFHSPNDVIVDASMPAMIRQGGKMWGADGRLKEVKAVIPESTFARIYQEIINFCKWHGNFDPRTMGTVPNVGLMAQQAEEYGSHDKTYEIAEDGVANITDLATGEVLLSQNVEEGDIWRMCQVKDAPVRDWVKLAVTRARNSGMPAVFWLDPYRPHENELIKKVQKYLKEHDTNGLDIQIMSQVRAMRYTLERVVRGMDTISVTGNILRDYLTDLFPIMELGTSAKMLSIVPLMAGGGMYETGAGGSAPKHVQQLVEENHLRWDSLGEFLALAVSLEDLGIKNKNNKAKILARTLDAATGRLLDNRKGPSTKTGELDNRGSQFYLAKYWAQELAEQNDDADLKKQFAPLAQTLSEHEQQIVKELAQVQGKPVDIGGYYYPDPAKVKHVMLPSATFNKALGIA